MRIVHVAAERTIDRFEVCLVPIRRELNAVREPGAKIVHEHDGVIAVHGRRLGRR